MEEIFVGIDLGTTNTLACYRKKGKPELIKFSGKKMIPSILYIDEDGNTFIGDSARKYSVIDPLNAIRSSKTYMADFTKTWTIRGKKFTPTDVATEILKEVKRAIVKKFQCPPETKINAVITIPAYFTGNQKDETKKAGIQAGFEVQQIITEPMAAAVAAGYELELNEKLFVVDLGGGTFDLSVLEADQKDKSYEAIDVDGDKRLGGDDFDNLVYDHFIGIIEDDLGIDLSTPEKSGLAYAEYYSMTGRVREAAEKIKKELSDETVVKKYLPNLFNHKGKTYDFTAELTREEFDDICQQLYDKIISRIKKFCANSGKFKLDDISTVILAGGSCYIPRIQDEVEKIFNKTINTELPLETLVAIGACFVANSISGGLPVKTRDILSHSLGVEVRSADGKRDVLSKILNKGKQYPCEESKVYSTFYDNQTLVPIYVYEAGADMEDVDDINMHEYYGDVSLKNIRKAPAGEPRIRVTFSYDKNGTLVVTAQDEDSGIHEFIEIEKGAERPTRQRQEAPIDFMLLLDTSGSMGGRPIEDAKRACSYLFDDIIDFSTHRMGFVTFETEAKRMVALTNDASKLKAVLRNVTDGGGTNLWAAFKIAEDDLRGSTNRKVIIIVTDGDPYDKYRTLDYANQLKATGHKIAIIAAGNYIDMNFISDAASPKLSYKIENMSKLKDAFGEVVARIVEAEG